ncbi:MAG TPA: class I SAM-dependent methyltransferase [Solirubrobacterales bacterium]|nr:class I SAM-dependent methyltransferase [Solirubrobacterales bacterium]
MSSPKLDQDQAYEEAVLAARADPTLSRTIRESFLDEDDVVALRRFQASEHWARIERLLASRRIEPGAKVLDLGGGRGLVSAALAVAGYRTVLCEPNHSGVCGRGAAERLRSAAALKFEVVGGDVAELAGGEFDAVVCRAVLHHIEPLVPVLRSVRAALRPGGSLICSDEPTVREVSELGRLRESHPFVQFGVDENALTEAQYRQALEEAGFVEVTLGFPVSWGDYRRLLRPNILLPVALVLYWRYRFRSTLRPVPGEVRTIVATAPEPEYQQSLS